MSSLLRLPTALTRSVVVVVDVTVTLLALPSRVLGLVAAAEQTLAAVNDAVALTQAHLKRTGQIIAQVDGVVETAGHAARAAAATVDQVGAITASAAPLLESYSEPLRRLEPTFRRMADTIDPKEVDALVSLIDRLPRLASAMDGDVLPLLGRIEQVSPDLNQMLDNVSDLNRLVNRMPKVFRRRRDNEPD